MKTLKSRKFSWMAPVTLFVALFCTTGSAWPEASLVVDHTAVSGFDDIPGYYILLVRQMTVHFVGESHSLQLLRGLELLAAQDPKYAYNAADDPEDFSGADALKVLSASRTKNDSGWSGTYLGEEDYWATPDARQMTNNTVQYGVDQGMPFSLTMWLWCWDIVADEFCADETGTKITFDDERFSTYINFIDSINSDNTLSVTPAIYVTSITDDAYMDHMKWRVTKYNDMIRDSAHANGGILFDNADIENWNNTDTEQRIYTFTDNGDVTRQCYIRHHDYDEDVGDQYAAGHTNDALCLRKAKAFWWMLARLSGWDGNEEYVRLTYPNGGEVWSAETDRTVTWESHNVGRVNIAYTLGNGDSWHIALWAVNAAAGTAVWTVPPVASSAALLRITDADNGMVNDFSDDMFEIREAMLWGDVNSDGILDNDDARLLALHDVNPGSNELISILKNIEQCGDISGNGSTDIIDALVCASYELNPDNPNLPPRAGTVVYDPTPVAKSESDTGTAIAQLDVLFDNNGERSELRFSLVPEDAGHLIGAARVLIRWDPDSYTYTGLADEVSGCAVNETMVSLGEVSMARFVGEGTSQFTMPAIMLDRKSDDAVEQFTADVEVVGQAETFTTMTVVNSHIVEVEEDGPKPVFVLLQNSPNPFNPTTTIGFSAPGGEEIELNIYNIQGQLVRTFNEDVQNNGGYSSVIWDGTDNSGLTVSSGIYIYRLSTGDYSAVRQMTLIR